MKLFQKKQTEAEKVLDARLLDRLKEGFSIYEEEHIPERLVSRREFAVLLGAPQSILYGHEQMTIVDPGNSRCKQRFADLIDADNKEDVLANEAQLICRGCHNDLCDFIHMVQETSDIDLDEFSPEARNAFLGCMEYALDLVPHCNTFIAWDISEAVNLLRMAHANGYMTLEETYEELDHLVDLALQYYHSWSEYAISLIAGGTYHMYKYGQLSQEKAIDVFDDLVAACVKLLLQEDGAWITHRWLSLQEGSAIDLLEAVDPQAKAAYDQAMLLYEKAEQADPQNARALYQEGMELLPEILQSGEIMALFLVAMAETYAPADSEIAIPYLQKALNCYEGSEDKGIGYVHIRLGMCYHALNKKQEATSQFHQAYAQLGKQIFDDFDSVYDCYLPS